jgi:hypothetical protein
MSGRSTFNLQSGHVERIERKLLAVLTTGLRGGGEGCEFWGGHKRWVIRSLLSALVENMSVGCDSKC